MITRGCLRRRHVFRQAQGTVVTETFGQLSRNNKNNANRYAYGLLSAVAMNHAGMNRQEQRLVPATTVSSRVAQHTRV